MAMSYGRKDVPTATSVRTATTAAAGRSSSSSRSNKSAWAFLGRLTAAAVILGLTSQQIGGAGAAPTTNRRAAADDANADNFDSAALLAANPANRDTFAYTQAELQGWLSDGAWASLTIASGHRVQYVTLVAGGEKGALVVSPGQSEPIAKYAETLRSYSDMGYSPIFAIDHVGQGNSDRLNPDHFMQHIESGSQFIEAFTLLLDEVLPALPSAQPRFLACHSMGCAVAFATLMRDYEAQIPTRFNAVVANAPLIKANTDPFPYPVATAIGEVMTALGFGAEYAPTQEKTFAESYGNLAFAGATTSSLQRWLRFRDVCVELKDELLGADDHVGLCLGGLSTGFAREMIQYTTEFDQFNKGTGKIATPVLIQTAGEDRLVQNRETQDFCSDGLRRCQIQNFAHSRHNIWWERDEIRTVALIDANAFLQQHADVATKQEQCPLPHECGKWSANWWSPWKSACADSGSCSYQYQFGDLTLAQSCRPHTDVC